MSEGHLSPKFAPARTSSLVTQGLKVEQFRFRGGAELPPHDHPEAMFVLQLRGGFAGIAQGEAYELMAGSAAWLPAATRHSERIGPHDSEAILVRLGKSPAPRRRGPLLFEAPQVRRIARQLESELREPDAASACIVEGLVLRLLGLFETSPRPVRRADLRWLETAIGILESEGVERQLGLTELASRVGVDRCHLARRLKERLGMSAGAFLRRQRIERARSLLSETDRPIAWIAHECGFYDHAHFCNVFRRVLGRTPSAFRARR